MSYASQMVLSQTQKLETDLQDLVLFPLMHFGLAFV